MNMSDETKVSLYSKSFLEITFSVMCVIYLLKLHYLNIELSRLSNLNAFDIIGFNNNSPLLYIFGSFIIVVSAVLITCWLFYTMYRENFYTPFTGLFIVTLILNIPLVFLTINFISIPILRAFLIVIGVGISGLVVTANNE